MRIDPGRPDDEHKGKKRSPQLIRISAAPPPPRLRGHACPGDATAAAGRLSYTAEVPAPCLLIRRLISFPTSSILFEDPHLPPPILQHLHLKVLTAGLRVQAPSGHLCWILALKMDPSRDPGIEKAEGERRRRGDAADKR